MGGWAVVSVSKIPDAWITGKPLELTWRVRQHGVTPLDSLHPTIEASSGSQTVAGTTWAYNEDGERGYRGSITFPDSGEWQVTIKSGFGRSRAVLVPWRVFDAPAPIHETVADYLERKGIPPLSESERGRRMFASQGCVTCHTHRAVGISGELSTFGPDLSDRAFPPSYLAKFLANPAIKPSTNGRQMPNPGLRDKDIAPLIAFINAEHGRVSATR
jgi:mono/diheme cytochrome c family protein